MAVGHRTVRTPHAAGRGGDVAGDRSQPRWCDSRVCGLLPTVGAEPRYSGVSIAQIAWPFVTAAPVATATSATTPALCATTSFSIFIASTMQITCPTSTTLPAETLT